MVNLSSCFFFMHPFPLLISEYTLYSELLSVCSKVTKLFFTSLRICGLIDIVVSSYSMGEGQLFNSSGVGHRLTPFVYQVTKELSLDLINCRINLLLDLL